MESNPPPAKKESKPKPLIGVEVVSGLISAAAVVVAYVVFGAPAWLGLAVGVALYLGITVYGSNKLEKRIQQEAQELVPGELRTKLLGDREKLEGIREVSLRIEDQEVRTKILTICKLAEGIFDNLMENRSGGLPMSRFFLYLERTIQVVEKYSRLSADPLGRNMLQQEQAEFLRLLDQAEEAFAKGYRNLIDNEMVEFKTMNRVLARMMDMAEIGR